MLYVDFTAGEKNYKLRLATQNIVALERSLGKNPLGIFGKGEEVPQITDMVNILFHSLQKYQHGIDFNKACNIFDEYLQEHTMTDFISVIIEIYKASGIMQADQKGETEEKNVIAEGN
jgi:hypothetical protein